MMSLMRNGRDRRSENPRCATRGKNACLWLGPISGSHQGPRPQRPHSEAEYMAAPERFAKTSDSSCTAGAVHTWHIWEVTHEASDFRLGGQSGLNASVARTAAFDRCRPEGDISPFEVLHCGGLLPCW